MSETPSLSRLPGSVVIVFDAREWGGRDVGDNSQFFHPATILRTYRSRDRWRDLLADVRFHHDDGRESCGHFVDMMRDVEESDRVAA